MKKTSIFRSEPLELPRTQWDRVTCLSLPVMNVVPSGQYNGGPVAVQAGTYRQHVVSLVSAGFVSQWWYIYALKKRSGSLI